MAAMVAAAMDVPVTMLLADPGVTGARATAETLDRPLKLIIQGRQELWASATREIVSYVIQEAVRSPRGPLKGTVLRDPDSDAEVVSLVGDQKIRVSVDWPDLSTDPVDVLVKAIVDAASTDKLPPLLVARLLMLALDVEDIETWMDQLTDAEGQFLDPADAAAARSALGALQDGGFPS